MLQSCMGSYAIQCVTYALLAACDLGSIKQQVLATATQCEGRVPVFCCLL